MNALTTTPGIATSAKKKFPADIALAVAEEIREQLFPLCARIEIAGSLRRRKTEVGDIEIIYVSKTKKLYDLLGECEREVSLVDLQIAELVGFAPFGGHAFLERRKNVKGAETFGYRIKLLRHVESGIPIDLFSSTEESWWNYLVCRTGGMQSNIRIASLAKSRGYKWEPYSPGFVDLHDGRVISMSREQDVFKFVALPYEEPWQRP